MTACLQTLNQFFHLSHKVPFCSSTAIIITPCISVQLSYQNPGDFNPSATAEVPEDVFFFTFFTLVRPKGGSAQVHLRPLAHFYPFEILEIH